MSAPYGRPSRQIASIRLNAAHLCSPKSGERENGDAVFVREGEGAKAMLAVVDGLGHGPEAAQASRAAVELLGSLPSGISVLEVMQGLHAELRGTRGAAATVCVIDGLRLEVCAVGNVQLLCVNVDVPLVLSAGVLGHQVARFRVSGCELRPGARLALISDGISTRFRLEELRHLEPAAACEHILGKYRRKEDDATVLIADLRR